MTPRRPLLALAALAALPRAARAQGQQEARIALQTETSSIDPHFALVGANQTIAMHIFDPLIGADANMRPTPGLTSFEQTAQDAWDFTIRPGATFHDGSPVTAEDIAFSLERMPKVPGSPAPFIRMAATTAGIEILDTTTIRLRTRGPDPSLPLHAMTAYIVSKKAATDASTADFNGGRAAIGSGPWRFAGWQPGSQIRLERHDAYWGPKPAFPRATIRPIANDAARLTALLAGDVDLIDGVPPNEIPRLAGRSDTRLAQSPSSRLIYIALDQANDVSPFVTAKDGSPLPKNPLRDPRIRKALSFAINRDLIVARILNGAATPAGQLVPRGFLGYDPEILPPPFAPDRAKRLLTEAGFPDGFRITLHSPNNRYVEDDKTAQAIGQMWARIGIDARVEVMPSNVFFTRAGKREFSAFLIGFGNSSGDAYPGLSQVLMTFNAQRGLGGLNRARYANMAFDALMEQARTETGDLRADLLRKAQGVAFTDDAAILPLHFPNNTWATRAGFAYQPAVEEATLAHHLTPG
ncbi:ABC transporter substrate-binding protein [Acetobacteraceae bacterium H6797]|nr:ABC transporter substrate-binding protein [Acetobacteraceae bacterium H6797]